MMSEINALWRRVRALQRKLARELAEYRLGLLCDDLCERWFAAWSDHKPLPEIRPFIRRIMDAGYRLLPLGAAGNYLHDCLRKEDAGAPYGVPPAPERRLCTCLTLVAKSVA